MDASRPHASQGRLSVIVVSIISREPSDPRLTPILRLKLLSELSMGHAAGRAAALKGLGSTPLRTRHRPTHPTDSPDRDSRRSVALKRAQGAPQRPYSGSLGFPGAGLKGRLSRPAGPKLNLAGFCLSWSDDSAAAKAQSKPRFY